MSTLFSCCITAFLNETGFNFVRKCIDLVEMRGEAFKSLSFHLLNDLNTATVNMNKNVLHSLVDMTTHCTGVSFK